MRTLLIPFALFAMPAAAATQPLVVTNFDSVRMEAPVALVVSTGGGVSARAEGDRDMLDRLDISVSGNQLTVRLRPLLAGKRGSSGKLTVYASTSQVRRLLLNGSGSVELDRMKVERGDVAVNGSGSVRIADVAADRLTVVQSGSGSAQLAGRAGMADLRLLGSGSLDAEGLRAGSAKVLADGSGSIILTANGDVQIEARGPSDVTIAGKAACKVNRSGNGSVSCGGQEY